MTIFCTDSDLLLWEPNLLSEAAIAAQTLIAGSADLAGTTLTLSSGALIDAHVEADQVVVLGGAISGCYPIVSVDSATAMTLSILYEGVAGDAEPKVPSGIGSATGLTFSVRTFWAQRRVTSELLGQAIGLTPGTEAEATTTILNPEALRRACVLGTIHMIYSILSAAVEAPEVYAIRTDLYQRLFRRELRNAIVHLDCDGDGRADIVRRLNVVTLKRV